MEQVFTKSGRRLITRAALRAALARRFRTYLDRVYGFGPDAIREIARDFDVTERQARKYRDDTIDTLPGMEALVVCVGFEAIERLFDAAQ